MSSNETILQEAARDGTLDPNDWPALLETIVARLDHIFHNEFPRPTILTVEPQHILHTTSTPPKQDQLSSQESQTADKENAPPSTPPSRPPVPPFSRPANTTPASSSTITANTAPQGVPQELVALHNAIRTTLTSNFPQNPPHTVQRLAELVLKPKSHYRFLPPYLRALDRVVSVSSPTTIFPLPQALPPSNSLVNGATPAPIAVNNNLSSDESLGGALLTPIPWLRSDRSQDDGNSHTNNGSSQNELISESTEMVDGPNGTGRIETVTVSNGVLTTTSSPGTPTSTTLSSTSDPPPTREAGGVTQGELLRQEQEAGVVPIAQSHPAHTNPHYSPHPQPHSILPSNAPPEPVEATSIPSIEEDSSETTQNTDEQPDDRPHARGPEQIGMEDMGPQQERVAGGGLDLAAAVGRTPTSPGRPSSASPGPSSTNTELGDKEEKGAEVDMVDADAEGEAEGELESGDKADTGAAKESADNKDVEEKDAGGDVVITDVDGNTDKKLASVEVQGDGKGGDAVDMTGL